MQRFVLIFALLIFFPFSAHGGPYNVPSSIPDTGVTQCYDNEREIPCPSPGEPFYGQDGIFTINPPSYTKLDLNGNPLEDTAENWTMVLDNVTGLIWEVKTNKDTVADYSDPHDADNRYYWYDPDPETNKGEPGLQRENNTMDFIAALNNEAFGGFTDWRLPSLEELRSIVDFTVPYPGPTIDIDYFPNSVSTYYWSSTSAAFNGRYAWEIDFSYGTDQFYFKLGFNSFRRVRAVRGGQPLSSPRFLEKGDGTVTDTSTGLVWEQKTDDGGPRDMSHKYTWQEALEFCANLNLGGETDWRLPTIKELASLVDRERTNPSIDLIFENYTSSFSNSSVYWSSTNYEHIRDAWAVNFYSGVDTYGPKSNLRYVRAVRAGQPEDNRPLYSLMQDIPREDSIGTGRFNDYSFEAHPGQALLIEVVPLSGINFLILDAKIGEPSPFAGHGDITVRSTKAQGQYELLIFPTELATYYISIFGVDSTGGRYRISARYVDRYIKEVVPSAVGNDGDVTLNLRGAGLTENVQVQMEEPGSLPITAQDVYQTSPTGLTATFTFNGIPTGIYDLSVRWPDGFTILLDGALTVETGTGPKLESFLETPEMIRPGRRYTAWLNYRNAGDADMPAPLFTITGNCELSLDTENIAGTSVQVLGIGKSGKSGTLGIGESKRIPIYFISPSFDSADLSLFVTTDTEEVIDWSAQKDIMRPLSMPEAQWDSLFPSLTARLGNTWTDYLGVLREDANLFKQRGKEEYDPREFLRFETRILQGEPFAAVGGVLRDADTYAPIGDAFIKIQNADDSIIRATETLVSPEGNFVIDEVPNGDYAFYVEGYYFETSQEVSVRNDQDVLNQDLFVKKFVFDDTPLPPPEIPDHKPAVVADAEDNLYMVWERDGEIKWAVNSGTGWEQHGAIPDSAGGGNPVLIYNPFLLENSTVPGLFCIWEAGVSPKTLRGSAGKITPNGIEWSDPFPITEDGNNDFAAVLAIDTNYQPIVIWLQKDSTIQDDSDLYFKRFSFGDMAISFSAEGLTTNFGQNRSDPRSEKTCTGFSWPPVVSGKDLPDEVPFLEGRHSVFLKGEFCGGESCPIMKDTASAEVLLKVGNDISLKGGAELQWEREVDPKRCQYIFKSSNAVVGFSTEVELVKDRYFLIGPVPAKLSIGGSVSISVGGSLNWKSNFSSHPESGQITTSLSGGPKGRLELLFNAVGGEATTSLKGEWLIEPSPFTAEFKSYCISISGKLDVLFGSLSRSIVKEWGSCVDQRSLRRQFISENHRSVRKSVREGEGGVKVFESIEIVKDPVQGTGAVYEGTPVLGGIALDIYNDGAPAVAKNATGEISLIWTKNFPASDLGAKVYASDWQGGAWGDPVEITPQIDFNKNAAAIFDSGNNLMAAWSSASNAGLDYDVSSVEEIMDATENADIFFSRRLNGSWTAPMALSVLPGQDEAPALAAGPNGQIVATWPNTMDGSMTLYGSIWNGASWSTPAVVAESVFMDRPVLTYLSGSPHIVWAQDTDENAESFIDWDLFSARWDGTAWTEPQEIALEEQPATTQRRLTADWNARTTRRSTRSSATPPEECCEKDDEDPAPPDPPKEFEDTFIIPSVTSYDPNEKVGTRGMGDQNYVNFERRLNYIIYFENKEDAAAPAQEVFVTDCLPENLDWTTLHVEDVSFGDVILTNPEESPNFSTRATIPDYRPDREKDWWVDIGTEFDGETGCMEVVFRTLDPDTEDLPLDVFAGFLPQEDGTGRGQGYITLSISPKPGLDTGQSIANKASIVFDTNEPIITNELVHTFRLAADSDGSKTLSIADAIIALKVVSGMEPEGVNIYADVDNNGKIGIEEALYVLQLIAEGE